MKTNYREALALRIIDTWLDYKSRYSGLPGYQVCIRNKGQVIFNKAYGHANLKTKRKLKTDDLFRIASQSKTFTSAAVLQLVQDGRLTLQQTVVDHLPQLRKHKDERFKKITVRDLLSNRSGIFRDGLESTFWELHKPFLNKEQLLQEVLSADLIYDPNTCTKYSNIGYALLGIVLENAMGMPYSKAMDTLVLQKLEGTHIYSDYAEDIKQVFADGHTRPFFEGKRLPLKHASANAISPATGFCASAEDTSLFFDTFLLGKGLTNKDLQQELLSMNWPVTNSSNERYGYGLGFNKISDIELMGHSGGYPGFSTQTLHPVGTDSIISFFMNTNEYIPGQALISIIKVLNKINDTFTENEAKEANVSEPLMNKWGGRIFVVSKTKGLSFPLDFWSFDSLYFSSRNGENYTCEKQNGIDNIGEILTFTKDKQGKILSAHWGASSFPLEDVFFENIKKTLM